MRIVLGILVLVLALASAAGAAPAPGFTVKLLDSRSTFDSRERLGKHVVVVRFQASWCRTCARESAALSAVTDRYRARGVDVIALHVQDTGTDVRRFLRSHRVAYRVALDPRLAVANRFGFKRTPDTFVIDKKGEIVARMTGASGVTRLSRALDDALREPSRRR